jgi:hypothetical protein
MTAKVRQASMPAARLRQADIGAAVDAGAEKLLAEPDRERA